MKKSTYIVSGASGGIGRAIAIALANHDASEIILLGRNEAKLKETQALLPNSKSHTCVVADLRNPEDLGKKFRALSLEERNLAGVIANAGLGGENSYGPEDRWDEILATNLSGTYHLVNQALPALQKSQQEFKHVILISSILARLGVPHYSAYCASKAGLLGLMRSWASAWAAEKILVNAICPGWVNTDMAVGGLRQMAEGTGESFENVKRAQMNYVPLKKMSEPAEVAALIAFLLSDAQTSITGQAFDINNGALMP
jgi:NAD(P)-dependent dehydrogenase (short-subunit alcohol dehydrogenase family)